MPSGHCLHSVGFDSTSYWVLQASVCNDSNMDQRFIVNDSIKQELGSKVQSVVADNRCLSYSLGEVLVLTTGMHVITSTQQRVEAPHRAV
jgi:hypothetical protein